MKKRNINFLTFFGAIFLILLVSGAAIADPGTISDPNTAVTTESSATGSIVPKVTEIGKISLSVDGLGTLSNTGTIQVQKPQGATVKEAYLMASSLMRSGDVIANGDIKINNQDVNWIDKTGSAIGSYNYWADVTSIVKPIIDSAPAGLMNLAITEMETTAVDGEVLVVIFDDPNQKTDNTIVLLFGAQDTEGDTFSIKTAQPIDLTDPNLAIDMGLGISFSYQQYGGVQCSLINVNDKRLTTSAGGEDDGDHANNALLTVGGIGDSNDNPVDPYGRPTNPRSDDELYNLLPFVSQGDTKISVYTQNPSNDDNIFFGYFYFKSTEAIVGEGIILSPPTATTNLGTTDTVVATIQDNYGNPIVGTTVTFEITDGPNKGKTGAAVTDTNGIATFSYTGMTEGTDTIIASFINSHGTQVTSNSITNTWISTNKPPVAEANGPYTSNEGSSITFSAAGSYDPDEDDSITYEWDLDNDGIFEVSSSEPTYSWADDYTGTVTLRVTDKKGLTATDTADVKVNNVAPDAGKINSPIDPVQVGASVTFDSTFTDLGVPDTHKAVWDWGDGTSSSGSVNEENGAGTITGEHVYTNAGVYWVKLVVTDDDGGSSSVTAENYIVVYDPNGGFVTGGGWINSPAGAYTLDNTLAGKATFGFVSKYEKGATVPTGNTEFQFKVADLNFKSTSYDWLVITGSQTKYKGTGTINGEVNYGFMLSAVDGAIKGDNIDKFRIKIWDKDSDTIIYDNEIGTPEDAAALTAIDSGSIVVHK